MARDFTDPYFVKRGISAEVAAARGYAFWDDETYVERMEELYAEAPHDGVMPWALAVARQGPGITVPRYCVPGFEEEFGLITAGLRPDAPVKLGGPTRHYHGKATDVFSLLPETVDTAYCKPQKFRHKVYFEHSHEEDWTGRRDHEHVFHGSVVPMAFGQLHGHTFFVYEESHASTHIAASKKEGSHEGINPQAIHSHQHKAKCLYTPKAKEERSWDREHDHEEMSADERAHHLERHHQSEDSGGGESSIAA